MQLETTEITTTNNQPEKKARSKPKQCPLKYSNFFLTINSNKNMSALSSTEYETTLNNFKNTMATLFNSKIKEFIILAGSKVGESFGLPRNAPREDLEKRITKAVIEYVVEIGPESHKLHCHALVGLQKRGADSKLNYSGIREWLEKELGYVCHFQSLLYRDAKMNLQAYISKSPVV